MEIKRLPDGELAVMQAIWLQHKPASASVIREQLQGRVNWPLSSLITVLNRLCQKGFLLCRKEDGHNTYEAIIGEEAYRQAESRDFLARLYANSLTALVSSLYDARSLKQEDIAQLQSFLDSLKGGGQ